MLNQSLIKSKNILFYSTSLALTACGGGDDSGMIAPPVFALRRILSISKTPATSR